MRNQRWRDEFIAEATRAGIHVSDARALLSKAATLQRLSEAQCNGDWPADNGERETAPCPRCETAWVPSVIKRKGCPDCRTEDRVNEILADYVDFRPEFHGDPRGCVLKIVDSRTEKEIGVPS